jgi:hypothetical protein
VKLPAPAIIRPPEASPVGSEAERTLIRKAVEDAERGVLIHPYVLLRAEH